MAMQTAAKKLMPSQSPWLELPILITELILERLPLSDYIRFSSICKTWHSIQKQHRICHSPFPPPMQKSIPWMVLIHPMKREDLLRCYSPFQQKIYPLTFPESICDKFCFSMSYGWFFLRDCHFPKQITLFSPVSKCQICLPPLIHYIGVDIFGVFLDAPLSMDCVALILDYFNRRVYLCRIGQKQLEWTLLDVPSYDNNLQPPSYYHSSGVYFDDKFYFIGGYFFVIESILSAPTIRIVNMDCSQLSFEKDHYRKQKLVESDGEILLVNKYQFSRFEVFKADFTRMMWVRMKSIEDRALFWTVRSLLCVKAADVGCKSNCVYFMESSIYCFNVNGASLSMFDMDTMCSSDGPPFPYKEDWLLANFAHWFLPSLDYKV